MDLQLPKWVRSKLEVYKEELSMQMYVRDILIEIITSEEGREIRNRIKKKRE